MIGTKLERQQKFLDLRNSAVNVFSEALQMVEKIDEEAKTLHLDRDAVSSRVKIVSPDLRLRMAYGFYFKEGEEDEEDDIENGIGYIVECYLDFPGIGTLLFRRYYPSDNKLVVVNCGLISLEAGALYEPLKYGETRKILCRFLTNAFRKREYEVLQFVQKMQLMSFFSVEDCLEVEDLWWLESPASVVPIYKGSNLLTEHYSIIPIVATSDGDKSISDDKNRG